MDDEHALLRDAVAALGQGFAVLRAERDAGGAVTGLRLEALNAGGARLFGREPQDCLGEELGMLGPHLVRLGVWRMLAETATAGLPRRERFSLALPGRPHGRSPGQSPGESPGQGPAHDRSPDPAPDRSLDPAPDQTFEVDAVPFDADRLVVTGRDITERVANARALDRAYRQTAEASATLQAALDATSDAFAVYDVQRDEQDRIDRLTLVMINAAGAAPLHIEPARLVGWELREVVPEAESSGLWQAVADALLAGTTRTQRVHRHDAQGQWMSSSDITIAPVGSQRVVFTWRDVTADERRGRDLARAHDRAWHAATHDPLTGLANRVLLAEQLREALWAADEDHRTAVVYIDLDRFKQVNDTLGHAAGDRLLRVVAGRLAAVIRTGDLAARIGGDEFVLLLCNVRQEWDTERFLERVRRSVHQPVLLGEAEVIPQASYGVVVCPPGPDDPEAMLAEADALMYGDKLARR